MYVQVCIHEPQQNIIRMQCWAWPRDRCVLRGLVVTSALFVLFLGAFLLPAAPPGLPILLHTNTHTQHTQTHTHTHTQTHTQFCSLPVLYVRIRMYTKYTHTYTLLVTPHKLISTEAVSPTVLCSMYKLQYMCTVLRYVRMTHSITSSDRHSYQL